MIGDLGDAEPVADSGAQRLEGLVQISGDLRLAPRQNRERGLTLGERGAAVAAGAHHAEPEASPQFEPHVALFRGDRHGAVSLILVAPPAAGSPVIEDRGAAHHGLDPAADARRDPHKGTDSTDIGWGAMVIGPPLPALRRAHRKQVMHSHPARGRLPGGFQHHRPRHVSRCRGTQALLGPNLNEPAARSSSAPNTLGESGRGRHSHSTEPSGATRQHCSQFDSSP